MVKSSVWIWCNRYVLSRRIRGSKAREEKKRKEEIVGEKANNLFS